MRFRSFLALLGVSLVYSQNRYPIVQSYFVPLPEDDLLTSFQSINNDPDLGARSPVTSTISIAISSTNMIIIYDHWEDGYELDPARPSQSTTEIWGDRNIANGAPPGVWSNQDDVLTGGRAIIIQNNVPIPRDKNLILFDGGDRVSAT
jgi:hypothetical protein